MTKHTDDAKLVVSYRFPESLKKALETASAITGKTQTDIVCSALNDKLELLMGLGDEKIERLLK